MPIGTWIDAVEAAYALEPGLDAWFQSLVDATSPLLWDAPAIAGFVFSTDTHGFRVESIARRRVARSIMPAFERLIRTASPDALQLALGRGAPLFGTLSERLFARLPDQASEFAGSIGGAVRDCQYFVAPSGTGSFLVLGAGLPQRRRTNASERARWTRLAAHIGAGLRLRSTLAACAIPAEAVLDPSGELLDAAPSLARESARDLLREAVRRRELARSQELRGSPDAAFDLWQGLVAGRWSLIDRFESDGKRFVVAHRNDPSVGDPRGLTQRERQLAEYVGLGRPYKDIAYTFGISLAAISNTIANACRKLGLRGRSELAGFFAPGGVQTRMAEFALGPERLAVGVLRDPPRAEGGLTGLTRAECDVACDLARGATVASIAERRRSSPQTVQTQIRTVYAKLGVGSRTELGAFLARAVG